MSQGCYVASHKADNRMFTKRYTVECGTYTNVGIFRNERKYQRCHRGPGKGRADY